MVLSLLLHTAPSILENVVDDISCTLTFCQFTSNFTLKKFRGQHISRIPFCRIIFKQCFYFLFGQVFSIHTSPHFLAKCRVFILRVTFKECARDKNPSQHNKFINNIKPPNKTEKKETIPEENISIL